MEYQEAFSGVRASIPIRAPYDSESPPFPFLNLAGSNTRVPIPRPDTYTAR
jgi:hypothetical protein